MLFDTNDLRQERIETKEENKKHNENAVWHASRPRQNHPVTESAVYILAQSFWKMVIRAFSLVVCRLPSCPTTKTTVGQTFTNFRLQIIYSLDQTMIPRGISKRLAQSGVAFIDND